MDVSILVSVKQGDTDVMSNMAGRLFFLLEEVPYIS